MKRLIFLFIYLSTTCTTLFSQYKIEGFSLSDTTNAWLDSKLPISNTELYTASEPSIERYSWKSSPLLSHKGGREGSLAYRGEVFNGVRMLYDAFDQQLLAELLMNGQYYKVVSLNQEQVGWFRLGNYYFKNFHKDLLNRPRGFYAIAFTGEMIDIIVKKRKKKRIESGEFIFIENDKTLLKFNEQYHEITNRRSIYKIIPTHKAELKKYFKSQRIRKFSGLNIGKVSNFGQFCNQLLLGK